MKEFIQRNIIWAIVIGGIIFAGFASAIWPSLSESIGSNPLSGISLPSLGGVDGGSSEPNMITLDIGKYLLGEELLKIPPIANLDGTEIPEWMLGLGLMGVFLGGFVAMALPLAFLYRLLDNTVSTTKEGEEFVAKAAANKNDEKDFVKKYKASQPPNEKPSHVRDGWSAISTAIVAALLAFLFGYAIAPGLTSGDPMITAAITAAIALVVTLLVLRPQSYSVIDGNEAAGINWGMIWVVLSGLIVVGVGTGLIFLMRALGQAG